MNLNDHQGDMGASPILEQPNRFARLSAEHLAIWFGTVVVLVFMVSVIGHGYDGLRLIPSLPFLPDALAGILLAIGLALLNWVGFRKVFGRWTRGTWRARSFLVVACSTVLGLEFILALAGILERNVATDYMDAAAQKIDHLIAAANEINAGMTSTYRDRLAVLSDLVNRAKHGDDTSGIAKCGEICRARILERDRFESAFHTLAKEQQFAAPEPSASLTARHSRLLDAMRTLTGKYATFIELEKLSPAPLAAGTAYRSLISEVSLLKQDVFGGKDSTTGQALILRITAETVQRIITPRGTVNDYIPCVLALGLILLVPAFSVSGTLIGNGEMLRETVDSISSEARLYEDLEDAYARRGQAKMNATVAGHVWENFGKIRH